MNINSKNSASTVERILVKPSEAAKVRPPFPRLPAFTIASIILSYAGYDDAVKIILARLCHNTQAYFENHEVFLSKCVK